MKYLLVIFAFTFALQAASKEFGYVVTISSGKPSEEIKFLKTQSLEEVQKSILTEAGLQIDLGRVFDGENVFFEYRKNGLFIYCEKKEIEQKSNGKVVYKKIKLTE